MEEVETKLSMQPPCNQVGFYLPKVVVELVAALKFQKWPQPRWEPNIVEMETLDGALGQAMLNTSAVVLLGKRPHFVCPGNLLNQSPP